MQIVIDISKKLYDRYKEKDHIKMCDIDEFEKALDRCIILPKGHGDLIDRGELEVDAEWNDYSDWFISYSYEQIANAPIIIPADKESEK